MRNLLVFGVLLITMLSAISCEKEEDLSPSEMIVGKWTITSQEILTTVVPGDGSYLQFNSCSDTCKGVDYKTSDTTGGSFNYILNDGGTILTIDDQSLNGGNWDGTWDVLELTDMKLRITTTTIFGNLKVEMSK